MSLLSGMRIAFRLHLVVATMLFGLLLVCAGGVLGIRQHLIEDRQTATRELVQSAVGVLGSEYRRVQDGEVGEQQAQVEALRIVASMRYGKDNYFWVSGADTRLLVHPMRPDLVGRDMHDFRDVNGLPLFAEFDRITRENGGGYLFYQWPKAGHQAPVDKVSYVERFVPWGWTVGSGVYLDDVDRVFRDQALRFTVILLVSGLGMATLAWTVSHRISRPLDDITRKMLRFAAGDRRPEVPFTRRTDEVGDLARALKLFKDEADRLDQLRDTREEAAERAADKVEAAARRADAVFNAASEAIIVCDRDTRILAVNAAFTRVTGYQPSEVLGRSPRLLKSGRHDAAFYGAMWRSLLDEGRWEGEIWNRRKDGEIFPEWLSIAAVRNEQGKTFEYVAVFSDIGARHRDEERIRWHARFDALTELPNRGHFLDGLTQSLGGSRGHRGRAALLCIDLHRIREVNDAQGQAVGDKVLQLAAKRLVHLVRETDRLGRLAGNEFAILLEHLAGREDAVMICDKIAKSLTQPFRVDHHELSIGVSIGIAMYPADAAEPDELLGKAELAAKAAQRAGGDSYRFWE